MHRLVTRGSGSKRLELSPSERMSESGRLSSFDALTRTINRSHDVFKKEAMRRNRPNFWRTKTPQS